MLGRKITKGNPYSFDILGPHAKNYTILTWQFRESTFLQNFSIVHLRDITCTGGGPYPTSKNFVMLERGHLAPSRSRDLFLFWEFSETKTIRSCANFMASSKDVGLYAFTLALRPSGANANAQLILPGENFSKENSDKF